MWRDVAEPVAGLVDETLIVRWVEDRRSGQFGAVLGAVSQTLVSGTQRHRPRTWRRSGGRWVPAQLTAHRQAKAPWPAVAIVM
jgi:hypothetical protein